LISVTLPVIRLPRAAINGIALLVLILGVATAHSAIAAISDARLTVDDPERAASFRAAVDVFSHQPITGAGPSLPRLTWVSGSGASVYRYAHNEYLQVLAELGAIGGLLLAASLFMIVRRLYQARRGNAVVAAGALAAMAALAVHAGFDFVWHVPAIPLLAAALVGLASPEDPVGHLAQQAGESPGEEST